MSAEIPGVAAQGEIWDKSTVAEAEATGSGAAAADSAPTRRFKPVDRQQMVWAAMDVDALIPADHLARAIWELTGKLDWSRFCAQVKAVEGKAGCSPYPPQLLASLWILALSEGIGSSREIEDLCRYHPAYRWLTGLRVVGYHTLADFRVEQKEELDELFAQVLAVLRDEGLIQLEQIMQDGTKVRAAASPGSMHREATLQRHLEAARERVQQLEHSSEAEGEAEGESNSRRRAAQQRAAREKMQRMEQSLEELEKVRAEALAADSPKDPEECRVSETEPEVRKMKQPITGGFAPSYNVQVVTDAAEDIIVSCQVVQAGNDQGQLETGLEEVQRQTGVIPKQAVVDEGYLSWDTVREMAARGVDLIGGGTAQDEKNAASNQRRLENRGVAPEYYPQRFVYDAEQDLYRCPEGQSLPHRGVRQEQEGVLRHQYRAPAATCQACSHYAQCCPGSGKSGRTVTRTEYGPEIQAFVEKMKTPEAQILYRERKRVAEFPNLWLKTKLGLRRFRVRGLAKVSCETLWACLTYNIQQWWRLRWKPRLATSAVTA